MSFTRDPEGVIELLRKYSLVCGEEVVTETFGLNPGVFDIKRIRKGDFYKRQTFALASGFKPKTIFVADPTLAKDQYISLRNIVSEFLKVLMRDYGFTVYTWKNGPKKITHCDAVYDHLKESTPVELDDVLALNICPASNLEILHFHKIRSVIPALFIDLYGSDYPLSDHMFRRNFVRNNYVIPQLFRDLQEHEISIFVKAISSYAPEQPFPIMFETCMVDDIHKVTSLLIGMPSLNVRVHDNDVNAGHLVSEVLQRCNLNAVVVDMTFTYKHTYTVDEEFWKYVPTNMKELTLILASDVLDPVEIQKIYDKCAHLTVLNLCLGQRLFDTIELVNLPNRDVVVNIKSLESFEYEKNDLHVEISVSLKYFFEELALISDSINAEPNEKKKPKTFYEEIDKKIKCLIAASGLKEYFANTSYLYIPTSLNDLTILMLVYNCECLDELVIESLECSDGSIAGINVYFAEVNENIDDASTISSVVVREYVPVFAVAGRDHAENLYAFLFRLSGHVTSFDLNLDYFNGGSKLIYDLLDNIGPRSIRIDAALPVQFLEELRLTYPELVIFGDASRQQLEINRTKIRSERVEESVNCDDMAGQVSLANLAPGSKHLYAKTYFLPKDTGKYPVPQYYRLSVVVPRQVNIITVKFPGHNNPEKLYEELKHLDDVFFCMKTLTVKRKWQAIPSASVKEELLSFSCSSKKTILLGRSAETKLYYVKLAENKKEEEDDVADLNESATIQFVVKAQLEKLVILKSDEYELGLTEKFRQLRFHRDGRLVKNAAFDYLSKVEHDRLVFGAISFFNQFTGETITDPSIYAGLKKYKLINFCLKNMVGACAVRTNICYILWQNFGLDPSLFSVVESNIHAFIGYKENEYCLGGAPIVVKEQEMQLSVSACINHIEENVQKQNSRTAKMLENPFVVAHQRKRVKIYQAIHLYSLLDKIAFDPTVERRQQIWVINDDEEGDQLESVLRDISKNSAKFTLEFISDLTNPTFTRDFVTDGADVLEEDSELKRCIQSGKQGACIIIRDTKFPPPSIINILFDPDQHRLDDVQILPAISMILILKKDQMHDCGSDLLSRVSAIYDIDWNLRIDPYENLLSREDVKQVKKAMHTMIVYEDTETDFMRKLLGGLTLEEKFEYEKGELVKAIHSGVSLCIINPPQTSIKYNELLRELACRRSFRINGVDVKIPDDFRIYHTREPYHFSHDYRVIATDIIPSQCTEILTQAKFVFYVNKDYRADKLMPVPIDPVIKQYKKSTLHLYVSETLPQAKWAELIAFAHESACQLVIYTPATLDLPSEMSDRREYGIDFSADLHDRPSKLTVMTCSEDTEFAASVFAATYDSRTVVRIKIDKETNYADVTGRIVRVPESNRAVAFVQSDILTLLESNYTVILYGDEISSELYGHLQSLLLNNAHLYVNGEKRTIAGRIYVLLPDSKKLSYVANPDYVINASLDAYCRHLMATTYINEVFHVEFAMRLIQAFLARVPSFHFNYMKFKHIVEYLIHLPGHNPLLPLLHADSNTEEIDAAKEVWLSFKSHRLKPDENNGIEIKNHLINKIHYRLNQLGFVCLVGETGSCKSAMIDALAPSYQLFYKGIEHLPEWLENGGVLVVDEANTLPSKVQRLLMGFFTEHQVVMFAGKYYQIKRDTHRLILAGNHSYYEGRGQSALFATGTVLFKTAKHAYLRDVVVIPLLLSRRKANSNEKMLPLANIILSAYDRANSRLPKHLKLTPRNVRMIILRFLNLLEMADRLQFSDASGKYLKLAFYLELKPLLAMKDANRLHPSINLVVDTNTLDTYYSCLRQFLGSYIHELTPTQAKIAYDLLGQIMIYQMCQRDPNLRSVPISGIKVMGMPGAGKSMLLNGILNALGYQQFDLDMNDPAIAERLKTANYFIYGKTSKPDLLNEQILFAEKHGLVMIIDEVNAIPRPDMPDVKSTESLLNRAMSDRNDDVRESGAGHSLFLTTANPPGRFANREELSAALNNRFLSLECTPPDRQDLIYLAESHGIGMPQAEELADMYLEAVTVLNNQGNKALTLRTYKDYLFAAKKKRPLDLDVVPELASIEKRQKLG